MEGPKLSLFNGPDNPRTETPWRANDVNDALIMHGPVKSGQRCLATGSRYDAGPSIVGF